MYCEQSLVYWHARINPDNHHLHPSSVIDLWQAVLVTGKLRSG
jgi:hypothetical protein